MLFCNKCQEEVTYDGGNWLACHCHGCFDSLPDDFPPQWEYRPTSRAADASPAGFEDEEFDALLDSDIDGK